MCSVCRITMTIDITFITASLVCFRYTAFLECDWGNLSR